MCRGCYSHCIGEVAEETQRDPQLESIGGRSKSVTLVLSHWVAQSGLLMGGAFYCHQELIQSYSLLREKTLYCTLGETLGEKMTPVQELC